MHITKEMSVIQPGGNLKVKLDSYGADTETFWFFQFGIFTVGHHLFFGNQQFERSEAIICET